MIDCSDKLYETLLRDLEACKSKSCIDLAEVECCCNASKKYWAILQEHLKNYSFCNVEDEIHFFKVIKPRFTSEIEYFSLLYYTHIFMPGGSCAIDHKQYWSRQLKRFDKFIQDNEEFYKYYKTDQSSLDSIYFVRAIDTNEPVPETTYYIQDRSSATSHDHLVASIIAMERYKDYVCVQLQKYKHVF